MNKLSLKFSFFIAFSYIFLAKISFLVIALPGNIAPIYPAAGLALVFVIVKGRNALLPIFIGSFFASILAHSHDIPSLQYAFSHSLLAALFNSVGATGSAALGGLLVRFFCNKSNPLFSGINILVLVIVGAILSSMISPTFGVLGLVFSSIIPFSLYAHTWLTWWVGDAVGATITAPFILAWFFNSSVKKSFFKILEALLLFTFVFLLSYFVFFKSHPFEYAFLPLLLWVTLSFGMRGVSLFSVIITILASVGTNLGTASFVSHSVNQSLVLLYSFLGFTNICGLFLAGALIDRKRALDSLATEKEQLAVTLRSIGDGVITTDTSGKVVLVNRIAEELCGFSQEEAAGKDVATIFNIIDEESRKPHENPVEKVLQTGKIIELKNHTLLIAKDRTERHIADSGAPIKNSSGETLGVVLVFRDVTEKHRLRESMLQSQKLESLGLMAGGIAHDFNNLIGGIFGFIEIALSKTKDEFVITPLEKANSVISRARGLTKQLLSFSKGGTPNKKVAPLFPNILDTAMFALSGTNVSCTFDVDKNLWEVSHDPNQIGQVVDNIVINGRQAMPNGGSILITAKNSVLDKGNFVKIDIKDSGKGIPKDLIDKIFDPFFTTKEKGHGLGLATCYSIISKHNGSLEVSSVLDVGTTFTIYLPA